MSTPKPQLVYVSNQSMAQGQGNRLTLLLVVLLCPPGQQNLYFSLPAIVGWLGTALLHAAITVAMVMTGSDSLESDRATAQSWSLPQNGLLMFTVVIITVHLQLGMVIDQWMWMHHMAIWGSIGAYWVSCSVLMCLCRSCIPLAEQAS